MELAGFGDKEEIWHRPHPYKCLATQINSCLRIFLMKCQTDFHCKTCDVCIQIPRSFQSTDYLSLIGFSSVLLSLLGGQNAPTEQVVNTLLSEYSTFPCLLCPRLRNQDCLWKANITQTNGNTNFLVEKYRGFPPLNASPTKWNKTRPKLLVHLPSPWSNKKAN